MSMYEIAKRAYEGAASHEKKFHEQLFETVMRLEQAIASYKGLLKEVQRTIEYEFGTLSGGFMPAMISLPSQTEKVVELQREIKDLTDRVKTLMWGLEWSMDAKDEMWLAIGATLKDWC